MISTVIAPGIRPATVAARTGTSTLTIRATGTETARRTGFLQYFHLRRRQNLFQLGFRIFLQRPNLIFLIIRQIQFFHHESRQKMESAGTARASGRGPITGAVLVIIL
jgi:hypothetical protein